MTVTSIATGPDGESIVHTQWFSGAGTLETAAFPAPALERVGESGPEPHFAA